MNGDFDVVINIISIFVFVQVKLCQNKNFKVNFKQKYSEHNIIYLNHNQRARITFSY